MELLLNLAWLLLALPAYWLWRVSRRAPLQCNFSALQSLLALGCVLVILFPVISATDDLCAMRAEVEESPASKRGIRHAGNDKPSVWNARLQAPPALLAAFKSFAPNVEWVDLQLSSPSLLPAEPVALRSGRAPPASSLAL